VDFSSLKYEEPIFDQEELNYVMNPDLKKNVDVYDIIARVFDGNKELFLGSKMLEFKKNYGTTLITGFAKLYG
jgi:3-methylcrotonyl-CoA carboxylase beta subunit